MTYNSFFHAGKRHACGCIALKGSLIAEEPEIAVPLYFQSHAMAKLFIHKSVFNEDSSCLHVSPFDLHKKIGCTLEKYFEYMKNLSIEKGSSKASVWNATGWYKPGSKGNVS